VALNKGSLANSTKLVQPTRKMRRKMRAMVLTSLPPSPAIRNSEISMPANGTPP